MKNFHADVPLRGADGLLVTGHFVGDICYDATSGKLECTLKLSAPGVEAIQATAPDFFAALVEIRRHIEPSGWRVLCFGSSLDVWGQGLDGPIYFGTWAVRLREGFPPTERDQVDTFGICTSAEPATVEEQQAYYEAWKRSGRPGTNRLARLRRRLGLSAPDMANLAELSTTELLAEERRPAISPNLLARLPRLAAEGEATARVLKDALRDDHWSRFTYPAGRTALMIAPPAVALVLVGFVLRMHWIRPQDPSTFWPLLLALAAFLVLRRLLAPRCGECGQTVAQSATHCPRCAVQFLGY